MSLDARMNWDARQRRHARSQRDRLSAAGQPRRPLSRRLCLRRRMHAAMAPLPLPAAAQSPSPAPAMAMASLHPVLGRTRCRGPVAAVAAAAVPAACARAASSRCLPVAASARAGWWWSTPDEADDELPARPPPPAAGQHAPRRRQAARRPSSPPWSSAARRVAGPLPRSWTPARAVLARQVALFPARARARHGRQAGRPVTGRNDPGRMGGVPCPMVAGRSSPLTIQVGIHCVRPPTRPGLGKTTWSGLLLEPSCRPTIRRTSRR